MKIVIDIPEDVYTRLFDNGIQDNEIATDDICEMARSLRCGTPLPKGHGRIIDESKITSIYYHEETAKQGAIKNNWNVIDGTDASTIIEADKLPNNELENPFNDSRFGG